MRQSAPITTDTDYPQQPHTIEDEVSDNTHNASKAKFDTENNASITLSKRPPNREIPAFTPAQIAKFWSQVKVGQVEECWPWTGHKVQAPYSTIVFYGRYRGYGVHRIAYTLLVGPIPTDLTIDHVRARGCTNTLCCNPDHLEPITQTEQVARRDGDKFITRVMTCKWGHVRPVGRKAKCAECAKRFQQQNRARKLAGPNAVEYRAKLSANRNRQRAAAKQRAQIDALAFAPSSPLEPGLHSGEYQ